MDVSEWERDSGSTCRWPPYLGFDESLVCKNSFFQKSERGGDAVILCLSGSLAAGDTKIKLVTHDDDQDRQS